MKIIATSGGGFLIEATNSEVNDLMRSTGITNPSPKIGTILPAMDFTAQIRHLRELAECGDMRYLHSHYENLGVKLKAFKNAAAKFEQKGAGE